MLKITLNRFAIFVTLVLLAGVVLQQCWQRKSDAQKWLYLFDKPARDYAGRVLGADRDTHPPLPEPMKKMVVEVHEKEGYVVFSSAMFSKDGEPSLHMAFATNGRPPDPRDEPGFGWVRVRDSWYELRRAP
ncbi:MAG: hypothetical protein WB783_12625 [Arenicellales bacterium]